MKIRHSRISAGFLILLLAVLACNLPTPTQATPETIITQATETNEPPPVLDTVSPAAPASTLSPPITHVLYPADTQTAGAIIYDVNSSTTASEHRAPYGDAYRLNRLERPFTQNVMEYLADVDIIKFRLHADQNWFYVFVEMNGFSLNTGALSADYGIELDLDSDGHGDYLIWARPPYTTSWATDRVSVLTDSNNDSGGISPGESDAPLNSNGYEQTVVDSGQGADPDLAWVRIDPRSPKIIQFAFKKSLAGNTFMWGAWADLNMRDPAKFSYNDRFTETEAGSPEKNETELYPIKQVYALDNTCREAYGFKPNGYEPLLCPREQPTPEPGITCTNPSQYTNGFSCVVAGCAWVRDPTVVIAVVYYCTYP